MHHIVVGAGPAGVAACRTLRDLDPSAKITLLGNEPEPPYSRMAIPFLLVEIINESGTYLHKAESYYLERKIDVIREAVTSVNTANKTVSLANNQSLDYDRLLIATGSTPIQAPIPGIDLPGIHNCWTLADARAIIEHAKPDTSVVLVGAGFIGCIILEALVKRGVHLTVIEREDRMVPRMMDATAGRLLQRWCESKAVTVHTNTSVSGIEQTGKALAVSLDNGNTLEAGLVITAMGVKPNSGFLQGSEIDLDQGILVDNYLETNKTDVFAAGDVAQGRDYTTGGFVVQAIQPTAVEHGRITAKNMVKAKSVIHPGSLNMNVLDTLGLISTSFGQWMGLEGGDSAVLLDEEHYLYLNLQFNDDRLVGASSFGYTQHMGVVKGLISCRTPLGKWKQRLMEDPTRLMEAYLGAVQGVA
ncbi:MAG: NAD(P)/FAD-dependent oxidoreductase [Deltaproteobacteria bacterium]|nr:NAD(P)/FAD-dependent oxidoreductase [Deltaproteobacteria bacterium]